MFSCRLCESVQGELSLGRPRFFLAASSLAANLLSFLPRSGRDRLPVYSVTRGRHDRCSHADCRECPREGLPGQTSFFLAVSSLTTNLLSFLPRSGKERLPVYSVTRGRHDRVITFIYRAKLLWQLVFMVFGVGLGGKVWGWVGKCSVYFARK